MPKTFPRVTLFVPGMPGSLRDWTLALRGASVRIDGDRLQGPDPDAEAQVEWVGNDGSFRDAFSFGTVADVHVKAIAGAGSALVIRFPQDLLEGRQRLLDLVGRLRNAGGLAVRIEESKVGWEIGEWLGHFGSDDARAWHRGAIAYLHGEGKVQSCGMHAFSRPDVRLNGDSDASEAQRFAEALNVYQVGEDPMLLSGQTFTPDRETPRRVLERWPDTGYPPSHSCNNPYGVWRLGPPGGVGRPQEKLASVFIPALRVVLTALEQQRGQPLTKEDVESARDQGACVVMDHRDARKLEHERGYADLEPELAWEQWQQVREHEEQAG